ncbi:MAG: hypothetical protein V8R01_06620 [Bacilli bacterium]
MEEIKKDEVKETKKTEENKDAGMKETKKKPTKKEIKEVEAPEGFTKKTNLNKKEYGYHNDRKYLKLKNGYGMWADTGTAFVISELK